MTLAALLVLVSTSAGTTRADCVGDCGGDCEVTVDEIVTFVNIALGTASTSVCSALPFLNCGAEDGQLLPGGVAGAMPLLSQPNLGDICLTTQFFAAPQ